MSWIDLAASLGGAYFASSSATKAGNQQVEAANSASQAQVASSRESNALQRDIYNQNRADAEPWRRVGEGALNKLAWKMGIGQNNRQSRRSQANGFASGAQRNTGNVAAYGALPGSAQAPSSPAQAPSAPAQSTSAPAQGGAVGARLRAIMQQYGLTDQSQLFGGSIGLNKTSPNAMWSGGEENTSTSANNWLNGILQDLASKEAPNVVSNDEYDLTGFARSPTLEQGWEQASLDSGLFHILSGPTDSEYGQKRYQFNQNLSPTFMAERKRLEAINERQRGTFQITPDLVSRTLRQSAQPEGFEGSWINANANLQYSPEFGLYMPEGPSNYNNTGLDSYGSNDNESFFDSIDPGLLMVLTAAAGGAAAGGGLLGGAAAPAATGAGAGSGGFAAGSLEALAAGANYGGISALPGTLATGGFNAGAGAFGGTGFLGSGFGGASGGLQFGGADSPFGGGGYQLPGGDYGIATPDMFGAPNSLFPASSSTNPGLLSQLGVGEASQMSLAPWADALAGGATAADLAPWIQAAQAGASTPGFFDQIKSLYDQYGKPINQASNALGALAGGSGGGSGGQFQYSADQGGSSGSYNVGNEAYGSDQYSDDDFGSLTRNFSEAAPELRKFTMADRNSDAVYQSGLQFGLNQGVQGLSRQAAASGSQLSGATLKALARYGNDYGTTKAQGAYDRFSDHQNQGYNRYADKYNRFNTDQSTQFNRLSGMAGSGQAQTNQLATMGQNYANQTSANNMNTANNVANNTIGAGNARAASGLASANIWNNSISGGINSWNQNNMLNNQNRQSSYGWGY